jgi:hypothetical protein
VTLKFATKPTKMTVLGHLSTVHTLAKSIKNKMQHQNKDFAVILPIHQILRPKNGKYGESSSNQMMMIVKMALTNQDQQRIKVMQEVKTVLIEQNQILRRRFEKFLV